jgi:hypothetical protein
VAVGVGVALAKSAAGSWKSLAEASVRWRGSPECPEGAPGSARAGVSGGSLPVGTGTSLDALFDHVLFGLTGTTPVEIQTFFVE